MNKSLLSLAAILVVSSSNAFVLNQKNQGEKETMDSIRESESQLHQKMETPIKDKTPYTGLGSANKKVEWLVGEDEEDMNQSSESIAEAEKEVHAQEAEQEKVHEKANKELQEKIKGKVHAKIDKEVAAE